MNRRNSPIGIFDSGIGGLSVVKEIIRRLPNENIIYFGDTARYPYGPRSPQIIRHFSIQNCEFLMRFHVKVIISACNTASSVAMDVMRVKVPAPVIGVVEPGAKHAAQISKTGRIGVIGTETTIASESYQKAILKSRKDAHVFASACPLFVPLVEEGWLDGIVPETIAKHYLASLLEKKIDTLILGCTHYPLLINVIKKTIGENTEIVDSAVSLTDELENFLKNNALLNDGPGSIKFFVSDTPERFARVGEKFLGEPIKNIEIVHPRN